MYKVLFNKGKDSNDNIFLLKIQYCVAMCDKKKVNFTINSIKFFLRMIKIYSQMGKCFMIGNDNQYYGISGSGDDGSQVTITDSSDG